MIEAEEDSLLELVGKEKIKSSKYCVGRSTTKAHDIRLVVKGLFSVEE